MHKNMKILGSVLAILLITGSSLFAFGQQEETVEEPETVTAAVEEQPVGIDAVAAALGVTTDALITALGDPSQGAPDFSATAEELGVDADELESLMLAMMEAENTSVALDPYTIDLNGYAFEVTFEVFTWESLPEDVEYERLPIETYTDADGTTHYYETIYLPSGNLNWYQAAYIAQDAGGYLACPTTEEENDFVFSLVDDMKYFWAFEENGEHYGISIGPFLGGFQPEGSAEPDGGWTWLSGDDWDYTNWAQNIDDGVVDKDPRDNTQPNNSGDGQPIMGFGEMNLPVATWGDYMDSIGNYGEDKLPGRSYGFVIEYESDPSL